MLIRNLKPLRDSKYLAFIRSRPSVVSGNEFEIVAHHVRCFGGGGTSLKPSDYLCLSLTAEEHSHLHAKGEKKYWQDNGVDPIQEITMHLLIYLATPDTRKKINDQEMVCRLQELLEAVLPVSAKHSKRQAVSPKRKRSVSESQSQAR